MSHNLNVNFQHPANAGILRYLRSTISSSSIDLSQSGPPDSVADPYYNLGTHPELVERLWDELGARLPVDCRWVLYGTPVLLHPRSGIVFAFAGGTLTYALRLPEPELSEAILAGGGKRVHEYTDGSILNIEHIGAEWAFGGWFADEDRWCLAEYRFAGDTC